MTSRGQPVLHYLHDNPGRHTCKEMAEVIGERPDLVRKVCTKLNGAGIVTRYGISPCSYEWTDHTLAVEDALQPPARPRATGSCARILEVLADGPLTTSELCRDLDITPPRMHSCLHYLESKGWIARMGWVQNPVREGTTPVILWGLVE